MGKVKGPTDPERDAQLQKLLKNLDKDQFVNPDGDSGSPPPPSTPHMEKIPSSPSNDISSIESSIESVMKSDKEEKKEAAKETDALSTSNQEKPENAKLDTDSVSLNDAWEKLKNLRRDTKINVATPLKDNPPLLPPNPSKALPEEMRFKEKDDEPKQAPGPKEGEYLEAAAMENNRQLNENLQRFEDDMQNKFTPTERAIKAVSGKLNEIASELSGKVNELGNKLDLSTRAVTDLSGPMALLPNISSTQQILVKVIAQMAVNQQDSTEKIDVINKQLDDMKSQMDESDEQAKKIQLMTAMKASGGHGNPNMMSMMGLFDNFGSSKKKTVDDDEEVPKSKKQLRGFLGPPRDDRKDSLMDLINQIK